MMHVTQVTGTDEIYEDLSQKLFLGVDMVPIFADELHLLIA